MLLGANDHPNTSSRPAQLGSMTQSTKDSQDEKKMPAHGQWAHSAYPFLGTTAEGPFEPSEGRGRSAIQAAYGQAQMGSGPLGHSHQTSIISHSDFLGSVIPTSLRPSRYGYADAQQQALATTPFSNWQFSPNNIRSQTSLIGTSMGNMIGTSMGASVGNTMQNVMRFSAAGSIPWYYPPMSSQHNHPRHAVIPRPYQCEKCARAFQRNHDLRRHMVTHLINKPYPCSSCDKSFSRKDALKV